MRSPLFTRYMDCMSDVGGTGSSVFEAKLGVRVVLTMPAKGKDVVEQLSKNRSLLKKIKELKKHLEAESWGINPIDTPALMTSVNICKLL